MNVHTVSDLMEAITGLYPKTFDDEDHAKAWVEQYRDAVADLSPDQLNAAWKRVNLGWTRKTAPLPAEIRAAHRNEQADPADGSKKAWRGIPGAWRFDGEMIELRKLCQSPNSDDPLVAIANSLETGIQTDPWRCMRNAMARQSMVTEKYGDEDWPTGSSACIENARRLVEKYARKVGISVNLKTIPLDKSDPFTREAKGDWSNEPALD